MRSEKLYPKFSRYEFWNWGLKFLRHILINVEILKDSFNWSKPLRKQSAQKTSAGIPQNFRVSLTYRLSPFGTSRKFQNPLTTLTIKEQPLTGKKSKRKKPLELQNKRPNSSGNLTLGRFSTLWRAWKAKAPDNYPFRDSCKNQPCNRNFNLLPRVW